jgi:hypothetical protein
MNDTELAAYLGIADNPYWPNYVANLTTAARATYERMREVEFDIKLWEAGIGPEPTGVILCREHKPRRRSQSDRSAE